MDALKRHPCRLAYCNLIPDVPFIVYTESAGVLTPSRSCRRLRLAPFPLTGVASPGRLRWARLFRFDGVSTGLFSSTLLFIHSCTDAPLLRLAQAHLFIFSSVLLFPKSAVSPKLIFSSSHPFFFSQKAPSRPSSSFHLLIRSSFPKKRRLSQAHLFFLSYIHLFLNGALSFFKGTISF